MIEIVLNIRVYFFQKSRNDLISRNNEILNTRIVHWTFEMKIYELKRAVLIRDELWERVTFRQVKN